MRLLICWLIRINLGGEDKSAVYLNAYSTDEPKYFNH